MLRTGVSRNTADRSDLVKETKRRRDEVNEVIIDTENEAMLEPEIVELGGLVWDCEAGNPSNQPQSAGSVGRTLNHQCAAKTVPWACLGL